MCCEEQSDREYKSPVNPYLINLASANGSKRNLTQERCGKPNCFCCCEDLACPTQQSGSTDSCVERSQDIDMYCGEIGACQPQENQEKVKNEQIVSPKYTSDHSTSSENLRMDMTGITQIRQQFYDHQIGQKNTNFQFAVFKFGPSNSDWDPPINDPHIDWSSSLVVQGDSQNTWQASSYSSCQDGCHTENVIINDQSIAGLHHMFLHECAQDPPHILNIYSFNSPCVTGPDCQSLIQKTLSMFFSDNHYHPCNQRVWEINIAWTLQFRDQNAEECNIAWGTWAADIEEEPHLSVRVNFGRQSVGRLSTTEQFGASAINDRRSAQYFMTIAITFIFCTLTLLFCFKVLSNTSSSGK